MAPTEGMQGRHSWRRWGCRRGTRNRLLV